MSCKAAFAFVLVLVGLAATCARATQIAINGTTTFFSNYEDDTNVATGDIPTASTGASFVPNDPQVGAWHSFQGTASPNFENVQVTDFDTPPGAFSGTKYLRTFRTPNLTPDTPFEGNPGTRIGYDGSNVTANVGDTYHFQTMIRAQLEVTNLTTMGVVGVNDLSTFSGIDLINVAFRSDGAIMNKTVNSPSTFVDTGLVWVQNTWDVLKIDYVDGADTYTLTYGSNSVELGLILASPAGAVNGNKRVGLVTFGNGIGGTASGNGAINGGNGSRLYYDSVALTPAVIGPHPGDFDLDGDVDGADFVAWQTNFPKADGAVRGDGDADGDGDVDGADFVVWQTNFPFTPGPGVAPVPEPGAILLASLGVVLALAGVRRER